MNNIPEWLMWVLVTIGGSVLAAVPAALVVLGRRRNGATDE